MDIASHSPAVDGIPPLSTRPIRLSPAAPALWRVVDRAGRIIGHLQTVTDAAGTRYRARLLNPLTHAFRDLGDFWSADDAVDCLRFVR